MKFRTFVVLSSLLVFSACGQIKVIDSTYKITDKAKAEAAVTILGTRSGGTGVILGSFSTKSLILTNNHVCESLALGGTVITDNSQKHSVTGYRQSLVHDMCIVEVAEDLGVNTRLADRAPKPYDEAIVVGHPALLPTIITKGHFSGKMSEDIFLGVKPCSDADLETPSGIFCLLFGGLPIIKRYEVQVVSPTIMPGSSGSAVYNSSGELAGLVFAGRGELGYGMIVPHEYILAFVLVELRTLQNKVPNTTRTLAYADAEKVKKPKSCREFKSKETFLLCTLFKRYTVQ